MAIAQCGTVTQIGKKGPRNQLTNMATWLSVRGANQTQWGKDSVVNHTEKNGGSLWNDKGEVFLQNVCESAAGKSAEI